MENIPAYFKIQPDPLPNPDAVVSSGQARFTVLTDRMIRMEWSPAGAFEDRASQAFWFRAQPVPKFSTRASSGRLIIETEYLRLYYQTGQIFSADTLWIELKEHDTTWRFGDTDPYNLRGTARTLDEVDGATPLGLGLISRSGWAVVDDSASLVFNPDGWLEPRLAPEGQLDLYFLGYWYDYLGCLREFNLVSGAVPMIPRFVLGNWWSRYWEYTQAEIEQLMDDFQTHQVPLSVCIIDMDWHITKTGNDSTGWTGYTWNRELFPDPAGVLRFMHEKGLKVALNLHPAEGIHNHEEMYAEFSRAVGQDPSTGEPVEFDITNPRFVNAYFGLLHHPQEERGVDFWWLDWQQGMRTRLSGLDPLWWLNHLHFLDLGRDGKRRSFIFSRWGGLGNHRYPIGFSGDSVVSWASLAFQPYFTATASNVNYGWWSHDIGGHMSGHEDAELYTRWVELGAFQPVLRLHSTKNAYHERRPWGFDANTFQAAQHAMQLRHAMIPYLYSMSWRYHRDSIPPILPMYYRCPEQEDAYACPNQYEFGDQLIVAPFITPRDADLRLSRGVVWLPAGDWYDYFTGQYYPGGWQPVFGTLDDIPVFARAGGIVPQGPMAGWDNVDAPSRLLVHVFAGEDGQFDLYEDEGNTNAYLQGAYAITPMRQKWSGSQTVITIDPAQGDASLVPPSRQVDFVLRGFHQPDTVEARLNGSPVRVDAAYDSQTSTITLTGIVITPADRLEVTLSAQVGDLAVRDDPRLATCRRLISHFYLETGTKANLASKLPQILADPALLGQYLPVLTESQARALFEVITGAGVETTSSTGEPLVVLWNNQADANVSQSFSLARMAHWWRYQDRYPFSHGALPRFQAFRPQQDFGEGNPWRMQINYYGVYTVKESGDQ